MYSKTLVLLNIKKGEIDLDYKYEQQFKKGALEMVLLSIISHNRTYGYEIILKLNNPEIPLFQNIKEGTLYPVLYRLEDSGLVTSELSTSEMNGRTKKYYKITDLGMSVLQDMKIFWQSYKTCIDKLMEG